MNTTLTAQEIARELEKLFGKEARYRMGGVIGRVWLEVAREAV